MTSLQILGVLATDGIFRQSSAAIPEGPAGEPATRQRLSRFGGIRRTHGALGQNHSGVGKRGQAPGEPRPNLREKNLEESLHDPGGLVATPKLRDSNRFEPDTCALDLRAMQIGGTPSQPPRTIRQLKRISLVPTQSLPPDFASSSC